MRISRIYIDQAMAPKALIALEDQKAHYLSKVLRLSLDSPLILFNNDGFEYSGRIIGITKKQIQVEILEQFSNSVESPLHTILGIGISRGERMDYAIQKSTELGVNAFVPLFTEHGEVKLKAERVEKRQKHWQQVAVSACEQSGRVIVPTVHKPISLEEWIKSVDCPQKLIFDHHQSKRLDHEKPEGKVAILIGPEGGFSEREVNEAKKTGFTAVSLGPRVLRTETAPIAVLSVLQYLWGDFQA